MLTWRESKILIRKFPPTAITQAHFSIACTCQTSSRVTCNPQKIPGITFIITCWIFHQTSSLSLSLYLSNFPFLWAAFTICEFSVDDVNRNRWRDEREEEEKRLRFTHSFIWTFFVCQMRWCQTHGDELEKGVEMGWLWWRKYPW